MEENKIVAYLLGEMPVDEECKFEDWLNQSDENMRLVEQVYFILKAGKVLHTMRSVDADRAYKLFEQNLERRNRRDRYIRVIQLFRNAAAILFLPLLLLSVYLMFSKGERNDVQYIEVKTKPGMVSDFDLPDGTKVWLNADGKLRYPVRFQGKRRNVELEGEAYFEVEKDEKMPFVVQADSNCGVTVLGTKFNISAYRDENYIDATLVEGAISFDASGKVKRMLKPNEKIIYDKQTGAFDVFVVNTEYDIAWKDGLIIFMNHPMDRVLKALGRYYNVDFVVKDDLVYQSRITGKFKNEQLSQILEYISIACGMNYKIHKPNLDDDDVLKKTVIEISKK